MGCMFIRRKREDRMRGAERCGSHPVPNTPLSTKREGLLVSGEGPRPASLNIITVEVQNGRSETGVNRSCIAGS